ncbi:BrnA antitoxin family protein [Acuticoccus sp. M5D2P5]|uniref:BrnA antitoxin family protein n=1 Tax=Acuticoccus kalidii TaxID=2910977 RepID=UPI001F3CA059|nr:BrnA antitoxin family protein [Acuticoccus kalidii]MCF3934328.1 BrnA antitoxin family protein [Acuticoccus kalidii]
MTRKQPTEEQVQRMIASDPDAPEITDEQIKHAKPFADAFPALAQKMRKSAGGRPRSTATKVAVSIRLDRDVVDKFKEGGPGWQSRINQALKKAAGL